MLTKPQPSRIQSPQPCLACRPHGRSDFSGLMGAVVAVRTTPMLAVLLVGGCGIDHDSRRMMGIETFRNNFTAVSVSHFLECAIYAASATPKTIICDKGQQFWCSVFKEWCDRHGITPRVGAVGQHGSIVPIERFILSLKN